MSIALAACSIIFLSGVVQGLTGFGSALVAIPLLSLIMDVKQAIPLAILNALIITTTLTYALRHLVDWRKILPLLIGSVPGVLLGATLLKHADPEMISRLLGILLIAISFLHLFFRPKPINPSCLWGGIAGFFSGAINSTVGAGGPPAIIYATLQSWSKDEIRATLTGFFVCNGYVTALVHAGHGIINQAVVRLFFISCGCVLLGTLAGSLLSKKIHRATYLRLVYVLLTVLGVMLLVR
ncbi:sulfite exporter TauE/SafE family protein [Desulfobulbus rhabdoformis]|uniref:sulfite exporter TauE/SafE family protein n=1 Tax=Desulfobulbus rhabdoformis TaxID=34032 RepID=UPI0019626DB4|nr:sulfite exporter TauE/SafE family protein [Desulfobulbus rhabdoformis]MBM9615545.1 sulfite exporter TauE/SafE family protein [Desulfobulbus rhabdoformis]